MADRALTVRMAMEITLEHLGKQLAENDREGFDLRSRLDELEGRQQVLGDQYQAVHDALTQFLETE